MKNFLIIYLSLGYFITLKSQTFPSSCKASDELTKKYKNDADELALQAVYKLNDAYKDSVKIKPDLSYKFLSAILAVYNSTNHPARDTVYDFLNIRALHIRDMNHIYVSADSNQTWMKNLRNNIIPTGNTQLDNLMNKYYLKKTAYTDFSGIILNHSVSFETDTNCNILALAKLFFGLPGYNSAGENQGVLDGNTIYDSLANNFTQLIFRYGWNDCWNGCINNRYWKFRVYNDCSVEYLGSFGDALPPGVGIHQNASSLDYTKIYPNPVSDNLNIDIEDGSKRTKVVITNLLGKTLLETVLTSEKNQISLTSFPNGMYLIQLSEGSSKKSIKLVKQ